MGKLPENLINIRDQAPTTTSNKIILNWIDNEYGFDRRPFSEGACYGRIPYNNMNEFIQQLEKSENYKLSSDHTIWLIIGFFALCTIAVIVGLVLENINIALISFACILFLFLVGYANEVISKKSQHKKREEQFRKIADDQNKTIASKQCSWEIGPYGMWIALNLHFIGSKVTNKLQLAEEPTHRGDGKNTDLFKYDDSKAENGYVELAMDSARKKDSTVKVTDMASIISPRNQLENLEPVSVKVAENPIEKEGK